VDRYEARLNLYGSTQRERNLNRLQQAINKDIPHSLSCKTVQINNHDRQLNFTETKTGYDIQSLPNEIFSVGDYVKYKTLTYLITKVNGDDEVYTKGSMKQCNYTLKFQHPDTGVILSYPCITSTKSFNQDESKIITLPSNQKSILCCFDENTSLIKTDDRFYVDKLNNTTWHVIGAVDNTSFNYGDKGLIYFIVEQDLEQNNTEYPDRPDLGVCNYFEPSGEVEPPVEGYSYATIVSSGSLTVGGFTRTITPTFYESDSTLADGIIAVWDIVLPTGYENQFTITYVDNQVKIKVAENYDLIEKTVTFNVMGSNGGYGGSLMLMITV
jgi:hypothetical protein